MLSMTLTCAATVLGLLGPTGQDAGALPKIADTVVDSEALHLPKARWNTTVNGTAFQQPALITHGGYQYTTWWDGERRLCIARRKLPGPDWEAIRFEDHRFESNDTHNVSVLGICPGDGTIHLAFDHHNSPLHYRVSRREVASTPEDFEWTPELFGPVRDALREGQPLRRLTYPRFIQTPDGGLQICFRLGASGNGDWFLADYSPPGGWQHHAMLISGRGEYGSSQTRCAYLNGFIYDDAQRLHLSWCWRETGDPMSNHDLNYAYSADRGTTWRVDEDATVALRGEQPLDVGRKKIRFARIDMYRGLANSTTQDVDSKGRVHLVTFHLPDETPSQLDWSSTRSRCEYFHYWRDPGGSWNRASIGFMGTRPQLVRGPGDDLYVVYTGDRYLPELESLIVRRASASDLWKEWQIVREVPGSFTGQPQVDRTRAPEVLSVYMQQRPEEENGESSPLRVLDFDLGGSDQVVR